MSSLPAAYTMRQQRDRDRDRPDPPAAYTSNLEWNEDREWDFCLPQTHGAYAYLAQLAAREGVQVARGVEAIDHRAVDRPVRGVVAVMPKDEREAKYGYPHMVLDMRRGRIPVTHMGLGVKHLEELLEDVEEHRHYEKPLSQQRDFAPPNWTDVLWRLAEETERRKNGRRRFSFAGVKHWF